MVPWHDLNRGPVIAQEATVTMAQRNDNQSAPHASTLEESPTFRGLNPDVVAALRDRATRRQLHAGEHAFVADEAYKQEVYLVEQGELEVRRISGEVYWATVGDLVGISNFLDAQPYTSSATARGDTTLLALPHGVLDELEHAHPELAGVLNRYIARRIRNWSPSRQVISGALAQTARAVMRTPLATCRTSLSLREAFQAMRQRQVGSLVILDDDGHLHGIMTYVALCVALIESGNSPDQEIADACEPAVTVDPGSPLWKVEELRADGGTKYVVVVEDGNPVGMLSQTDILRSVLAHGSLVVSRIREAPDLVELGDYYQRMAEVAEQALETHRRVDVALRLISETHLAIQRRCAELTLEQLEVAGAGLAPAPYALLIMGSGGRMEMLLTPDQDNGIILADTPAAKTPKAVAWFQRFCHELNENLAQVGYELCKGGIMARNPQFHKSLQEWRDQIAFMTEHPGRKAARWSNIAFDFETLFGDDSLTATLRSHVYEMLDERSKLLAFMAEDDAEGRPPIGWFNRLVTTESNDDGGTVDIKRNGLRIIADAARIFALHAGIQSRNTHDRLTALVRLGALDADLVDSTLAAYSQLHELLITHQLDQVHRGEPPDKKIHPERLSSHGRESLRESMLAVKRFQERLQGQFGFF